jgi:glycosyltransferase involved in cell wall biosynthesis
METCHIHLFTSNYLEGWGAVVNEGMNSGCVEVVNAQVGAAPYLIRHGENGLVYPNDSYERMEELVLDLFAHWDGKKQMGQAAYETIRDTWNASHAAEELLRFVEELQRGSIVPAGRGPLSVAPVIRPGKECAWTE